jgi:hypothetical protein
MNAKEQLEKIQAGGIFTAGLPFEQFVSDLCKRYARIYKEILPITDLDYIVEKLSEKGLLEDEEEIDEPIYM